MMIQILNNTDEKLKTCRFHQIWNIINQSWNEKGNQMPKQSNKAVYMAKQTTKWRNNEPQQQDLVATTLFWLLSNTNENCNMHRLKMTSTLPVWWRLKAQRSIATPTG
ncbi:hypothetical protein QL285_067721 [Trifolium repens]|nr:hypothetical protein QL285_067721 [Trifolium repens]